MSLIQWLVSLLFPQDQEDSIKLPALTSGTVITYKFLLYHPVSLFWEGSALELQFRMS
jgi:hypothetical protein